MDDMKKQVEETIRRGWVTPVQRLVESAGDDVTPDQWVEALRAAGLPVVLETSELRGLLDRARTLEGRLGTEDNPTDREFWTLGFELVEHMIDEPTAETTWAAEVEAESAAMDVFASQHRGTPEEARAELEHLVGVATKSAIRAGLTPEEAAEVLMGTRPGFTSSTTPETPTQAAPVDLDSVEAWEVVRLEHVVNGAWEASTWMLDSDHRGHTPRSLHTICQSYGSIYRLVHRQTGEVLWPRPSGTHDPSPSSPATADSPSELETPSGSPRSETSGD